MSWIGRIIAMERSLRDPDRQLDVESSEMREDIPLRYYLGHGYGRVATEELGMRIDDCLVDYISFHLQWLATGDISIEEFKPRMRKIEEGMKEDPALKAFEVTLQGRGDIPLASRTYLKLARRHALHGGKRSPSNEEGRHFALVQLHVFMEEDNLKIDWDRETLVGGLAVEWLNSRDPSALQRLIDQSQKSPVFWDTLQLICQELANRGEKLPYPLLRWYFVANHGHPERPDEGSAPRHRPRKLAYKLRDNEIRYTVTLLALVGMPKTDGRSAVAEAFGYAPSRIGQICREPYSTAEDLVADARRRTEPSYGSLLYGPDPNSGSSTST